ncbi:MAG: DUF2807 domain-containing protein [Saprospiraceae bacterium]|nr:DUF2807 domain-containing protein [Saprospiraceae bacterium]
MNQVKSILILAALCNLALGVQAQVVKEDRNVGSFDAIEVGGGIDLQMTQGNGHEVRVEAREKDMDNIVTEVSGGTLRIRMKKNTRSNWNWGKNTGQIVVYATFRDLEALKASGGSDVIAKGTIEGDFLEIESSGGSDIELEVRYNAMECNGSGGADLDLGGSVREIRIDASGGSDIEARRLQVTEECIISASGGSDTHITVNGDLDVSASGASDVFIYGNPKHVRKHSSGASDIHMR